MAFHKCRNEGCEVQIEVRNTAEGWRPFEESGNKHNCQFSEYAKKQRAYQQEQEKNHNNHGNEDLRGGGAKIGPILKKMQDDEAKAESPKEMYERYVDHTQSKLKLKILTDPTPEGLSHLYNSFGESHNIRFSQYQVAGSLYTIAVWYEEIPLKQ